MAKEAKPDADAAEAVDAAPPRTNKKLLIIIAVALALFLGVAGGAAYFLIKGSNSNLDAEGAELAAEKSKAEKMRVAKSAAPVYVALDPFTVNLVPEEGNSQFLQLAMSAEVADHQVGDRLKMYTPKLRNNVMMMLSGKKAAELLSKDGKETLADEIRDLINDILAQGGNGTADEPPVREVLFTSFIIQ